MSQPSTLPFMRAHWIGQLRPDTPPRFWKHVFTADSTASKLLYGSGTPYRNGPLAMYPQRHFRHACVNAFSQLSGSAARPRFDVVDQFHARHISVSQTDAQAIRVYRKFAFCY